MGSPTDRPAHPRQDAEVGVGVVAVQTRACRTCGAEMPASFRFCGHCGSNLAIALNFVSTQAAERRLITVMFCDIVGSTALSRRLDPEVFRIVLDRYVATCTPVIHGHGGVVARCEGDGLVAFFGYPQANEDDPYRAVLSGLALIGAIRGLNERQLSSMGASLQVRIGIHSGLVVVGEMGHGATFDPVSIIGETVNVAARLQQFAEVNTVLVSEPTRRLVSGKVRTHYLGHHIIKGLDEPMPLHRALVVRSPRPSALGPSRRPLPLIGREPDLRVLIDAWRGAASSGKVVILAGEAGIGKSRLIDALKDRLEHEKPVRLELLCSQHHAHTAFYPVIDLLRRSARLSVDDAPDEVRCKLADALAPHVTGERSAVDLLQRLVSVSLPEVDAGVAEQQKRATIELLSSLVADIGARRRLLLIVEDVHWADPSTLELLEDLVRRRRMPGVLCLLSCRSEFIPRWAGHDSIVLCELARLTPDRAVAMVRAVPGSSSLGDDLVAQIIARTEGVPLFIEELTKMLVEVADRRDDSGPEPVLGGSGRAIPDTLQGLLTARLDRLGPTKALAQLAAAVGREFSYDLISAVCGTNEVDLRAGLWELTSAGLLHQAGTPPNAVYRFGHSLIQDAAYNTLLLSRRVEIHSRIADAIISCFPTVMEAQPELVATHLAEAGDAPRAVVYWRAAGERSLNASANLEAITHFKKGIEQLRMLPATLMRDHQEAALSEGLAAALRATKGYAAPEVETAYARAHVLCRRSGASAKELFKVIGGLQSVYQLRGPMRSANDLAQQLVELAQKVGDDHLIRQASRRIGWCMFCRGDLLQGRDHLERALPSDPKAEDEQDHSAPGSDPAVIALTNLAWLEWFLGYSDRAKAHSRAARLLSKGIGLPLTEAYAICMAAAVHQCIGHYRSTARLAQVAFKLSQRHGFPYWQAWAKTLSGWAVAKMGQYSKGIGMIEQGLNEYRRTGAELFRPYVMGLLAEAHIDGANAEAAFECVSEGLLSSATSGVCFFDAELHRLRGDTWSKLSYDVERAEISYLKAADLARSQGARALLLRAAISRATLPNRYREGSVLDEIENILQEFTEGFDTPDLVTAGTLLDRRSTKSVVDA